MADILPETQQMLVSSFLEIAVGETTDTARQFLEATNWNFEEAILLFYNGNDTGAAAAPAASFNSPPLMDTDAGLWESEYDDVRPPLPVRREVLYGENSRNYDEEEPEQIPSFSSSDTKHDSLVSLYRPPYELMYNGPFQKAKDAAAARNNWLLVNLQSPKEFTSDLLNRDTWANEIVAQTIQNNFVFWQVDDDTEEGRKVRTYYKLDSSPVILVIDPITGQQMRSWNGMVEPEKLLEDAMVFIDSNPSEYHTNLIHKQSGGKNHCDEVQEISEITDNGEDQKQLLTKKISYPSLPEEPKCDRNLLCRIAIRLPDGRRIQRNFLRTDSIKLLWSFCSTQLEEEETRPFRFTQAMPGDSKFFEYDSNLTFEESGLANSIVSVVMM